MKTKFAREIYYTAVTLVLGGFYLYGCDALAGLIK